MRTQTVTEDFFREEWVGVGILAEVAERWMTILVEEGGDSFNSGKDQKNECCYQSDGPGQVMITLLWNHCIEWLIKIISVIITITISSNVTGAVTALIFTIFFLERCHRTMWSDTWSSQSYQVYSAKSTNHRIDHKNHSFEGKLGISRMEGILTLNIVSTGDIFSGCVCFFGNCNGYD